MDLQIAIYKFSLLFYNFHCCNNKVFALFSQVENLEMGRNLIINFAWRNVNNTKPSVKAKLICKNILCERLLSFFQYYNNL